MIRYILPLLFALLLPSPAHATPPQTLNAGGAGIVKEVVSGDTLILADGRTVKLAGIQAPKINAGRTKPYKWSLADEAKKVLESLALGRTMTLHFGPVRQDRHDRLPAQLIRDDGLWVQGEMLSRGLARVYPSPDLTTLGGELFARERTAREARLGIWNLPFSATSDRDSQSQILKFIG